jgi:hypothetical protein
MFVGKAGSFPSGAHFRQAVVNITQGYEYMPSENTLAYYASSSAMKKRF